jgi:hypothetical protein
MAMGGSLATPADGVGDYEEGWIDGLVVKQGKLQRLVGGGQQQAAAAPPQARPPPPQQAQQQQGGEQAMSIGFSMPMFGVSMAQAPPPQVLSEVSKYSI